MFPSLTEPLQHSLTVSAFLCSTAPCFQVTINRDADQIAYAASLNLRCLTHRVWNINTGSLHDAPSCNM
jgi:hypothetical protein